MSILTNRWWVRACVCIFVCVPCFFVSLWACVLARVWVCSVHEHPYKSLVGACVRAFVYLRVFLVSLSVSVGVCACAVGCSVHEHPCKSLVGVCMFVCVYVCVCVCRRSFFCLSVSMCACAYFAARCIIILTKCISILAKR